MKSLKLLFAAAAALVFGYVAEAGVLPASIGPATVGEKFSVDFSLEDTTASVFGASLMQHGVEVTSPSTYSEAGSWTDYACSSRASANLTLPFEFPCCGAKYTACNVSYGGRITLSSTEYVGQATVSAAPMYYVATSSRYTQISDITLAGGVVKYKSDSSSATLLFKGEGKTGTTTTSVAFTITLYGDGRVTIAYSPLAGLYVGNGYPSLQVYGTVSSNTGFRQDPVELSSLGGDVAFRPLAVPPGYSFTGSARHFEWTPSAAGTYEFGVYLNCSLANQVRYYTLVAAEAAPKPSIKTVEPVATSVELTNGQTQSFEVKEVENAEAATFSYRWYRFNSTMGSWSLISTATSAKYDYTQSGTSGTRIKVALFSGDEAVGDYDSRSWTIAYKASDPVVKSYVPESPVEQKSDEPTALTVVLEDPTSSAYYVWYKKNGTGGFDTYQASASDTLVYGDGDATEIMVQVFTSSDGKTKIGEYTWTLAAAKEDPSPEIEACSPTVSSIEMSIGDKQVFSVTAKSNDASDPTYYWTDNGEAILDGSSKPITSSSYEYEMTTDRASKSPHTIVCQVMNGFGKTVTQAWTITKKVEPLAPVLPNGSYLPDATIGKVYSYTFQYTGGDGTFSWAQAAKLPDGFSIVPATGVLSAKSAVSLAVGEYSVSLNLTNYKGTTLPLTYLLKVVSDSSGGGGTGDKVNFVAKDPATGDVAAETGKDCIFEIEVDADPKSYEYGFTLRDEKNAVVDQKMMELNYVFNQATPGKYLLIFEAKCESITPPDEIEPLVWEITVAEGEKPAAKIFVQKNAGPVAMTVGEKRLFEVEITGDTSGYTYEWYIQPQGGSQSKLATAVSSYEYEATTAGAHEIMFYAFSNTDGSDYAYFTWPVAVEAAPAATGSITAASPDPFDCSNEDLKKGELLTLADGQEQMFSVTVDATAETLVYRWMNGGTGETLPGASTTSSSCAYTHSASPEQTMIYCMVYDSKACDPQKDSPLAYAVWCIAETAEPLEIVTDKPVTDGMVEIPYGPIQFGLKDDLGVAWDALPQLTLVREASTFATAADETKADDANVTKLTVQSGQTNRIFFDSPLTYSLLGVTYGFVDITPWYGTLSLQQGNSVEIYGLAGEWAFTKAGDGVYVRQFGDRMTIRWQGQRVSYTQGGGGTGTGTGSGGGSMVVTTNDAAMAITLYRTGEVRVSFGACDDALKLAGPYLGATGAKSATLNLAYQNTTDEKASNADDVFFKSTLPPGLTFIPYGDGAGTLSGTPTKAGTYSFTISGKNGENPASTNLTITIFENNIPKPAFVTWSPTNEWGQTYIDPLQVGTTTNFSVTVENTTTIDWYVDDVKKGTGETFSFTPTQAQVNSQVEVACKLSNASYANYAVKTWSCNITPLPLKPDLEDGATIPVHVKQFESFQYKLGATGGAYGSYTWGHDQYYRVSRAEGSSWATYDTGNVGWMSLAEQGIVAVDGISPQLMFCGNSNSVIYVEANGCVHFNGPTSYANGLLVPTLKLLMPFGALTDNDKKVSHYARCATADEYAFRWQRKDKGDTSLPFNFALVFKRDGSEEIRYVYGPGNVTTATNLQGIGYCDGAARPGSPVQLPGHKDPAGMGNAPDIILTPQLPKGLTLAADGTISGTTTAAPGTYELKLRLENGITQSVTYQLVVEAGDNAAPVLVSSSPSATNAVLHIGEAKSFSVTCTDADGDPLTYQWKTLFGGAYETQPVTGDTLNYTPDKGITAVLCYALDGVHEPTLVRRWDVKVKDEPLAFVDSTVPSVATCGWVGGSAAGLNLALNDADAPIASVTLASGTLPAGVRIEYDNVHYVRLVGSPRVHGTYYFALKVDLADGDTGTLPLTLVVTGSDYTAVTWYVDPVNGSYSATGLSSGNAFKNIITIGTRLLAGDTVVFLPGDQSTRFAPVEGVNYIACGGEVVFVHGSADTSCIQLEQGATIAFLVGGTPWRYDEAIDVVRVPGGANADNYTVRTTTPDFVLHGGAYIEDGWLRVKPLWYTDDHGRIIMTFADVPAETGCKEYTFQDFTIPHAAVFNNEGETNATVRFAGNCECSWKFCTFLLASNGVDLVLDDNATLYCHAQEKIEGFDTLTFGRNSKLKIDNIPNEFTVRSGVVPVFAAAPGSYTIELANALEWGAWRGLITEFADKSPSEFNLVVPPGEDAANYQFQKLGNQLWVVKRDRNGDFPDLNALCPPARINGLSPAASAATVRTPLELTAGTPARFLFEADQQVLSGFFAMVFARWELNGEPIAGGWGELDFTPTDDMADGTTNVLSVIVSDQYHDAADRADWYFIVKPQPPQVATLRRLSVADGQPFSRDFREFTSLGQGAYTYAFARNYAIEGLELTAEGVLSGTMSPELDDEELHIVVTDEAGASLEFTQLMHLKTSDNEPPYLESATPAADKVELYIGDGLSFSVTVLDDEGDAVEYQWLLDGVKVRGNYTSHSITDDNPAHETDVCMLACQIRPWASASDSDWRTVKTWEITKCERPTEAASQTFADIPVGTKNVDLDLGFTTEQGEHLDSSELVSGALPDGLRLAYNRVIGETRKLGTFVFSVRFTSSNGQTATGRYQVTVTGALDTEPRTWYICSSDWWSKHPGLGSDFSTRFDDLEGLAAGDTVLVNADAALDPIRDTYNRLGLSDVNVRFESGAVRLQRDTARPLDLSRVVLGAGVTVAITLPQATAYDAHYGTVVKLAKLPAGGLSPRPSATSDYYFFEGGTFVDADGDLAVKMMGYKAGYEGTGRYITFPDVAGCRDGLLANESGLLLSVDEEGVMPASLTLADTISFGTISVLHETKLIFSARADVTLGTATESGMVTCHDAVEIARGCRITLSGKTVENGVYGISVFCDQRSVVFTGEGAKTTLVLGKALPEHGRLKIFTNYCDNRDPSENMTLELPADTPDPAAYHFVVDDRDVYVYNYDETTDEDHGAMTWTESGDLGSVAFGTKLNHTFTPAIETSDDWAWFHFYSEGKPYAVSRGECCTFSETVGTRELVHVPNVRTTTQRSANTVELGFGFPIEGRRALYVKVLPNGIIDFKEDSNTAHASAGVPYLQVLKDSTLANLTQAYKHVYIARGEGTFTVRWDRFAMVTLHEDGRIVVAYGPLADDARVSGTALCPTRFNASDTEDAPQNVTFQTRGGLYANEKDVVFTPTGVLGTSSVGSESGTFTSTGKELPGTYSVVVRANVQTNDFTVGHSVEAGNWTRTFTWTVTGDDPANPVIASASSSVPASEDGLIHVREGEAMPTFTATAGAGTTLRWYFNGKSSATSAAGATLDWTPAAPSRSMSDGLYSVVLKATCGDLVTYRQWFLAYNRTFHVDANAIGSSKEGTAANPWSDFRCNHPSGGYESYGYPDYYVPGDVIVVHPGTYHTPIVFVDFDGGVMITNAVGGLAENTILEPVVTYSYDSDGKDHGRRAFTHSSWELMQMTDGWRYVRAPVTASLVSGLTIRDSALCDDTDNDVARYGVAGGGAFGGTFLNCVFMDCAVTNCPWKGDNPTKTYGGAAYGAKLVNCAIVGCRADIGGAASACTLVNCTVADNEANEAAGGLDGQCAAYNSIVRYNLCKGQESEYATTYRPSRLVPDEPTIVDCFTTGDPLFCSDYTLFEGSPCIGAGKASHYPADLPGADLDLNGKPRFTDEAISLGAFEGVGSAKVMLKVEVEGLGAVTPNGCAVVVGGEQTFTATSERSVIGWYTNGVLAASSGASYTWRDIPAVCTLKVVFGKKTIRVGPATGPGAPYDYATIREAVAAAGSGDLVTVAAGTYAPFDVSGFAGTLEIRAESYRDIEDAAYGAYGDVIVDGGATQRCVTARLDDESIVLRGLVLTNGYVNVSDDQLFYDELSGKWLPNHGGGGLRGGRAENCTITGCRAFRWGGGSYGATLVRCRVENNAAFRDQIDNKKTSRGGGAFGGAVTDCRVSGNSVDSSEGGGTYDAVVKNSFVWDNEDGYQQASNVSDGEKGASLYVSTKVPTASRVAAQPVLLQEPGEETVVFQNEADARALAAATAVDVPGEIVANRIDVQEYVERFEVKTVENPDGEGFVNKVELKASEVAKVEVQIEEVLTKDDGGNDRTEFNVEKMEKTLTETTPGLYYALEFSSDLSAGSFKGDRHLATGKGSVKLSATSLDTPSGFWRVNVYVTPDGD